MLERDGYPPGVPCWVDTTQPDPDAAVAFYSGLFGWELQDALPPGSSRAYFIARLGGGDVAGIGSQPEGDPTTGAWNTYIWVESADEAAESFYGSLFGWETLGLPGASRCGDWQATVTSWSRAIPGSASGWRRTPLLRRALRMSSRR